MASKSRQKKNRKKIVHAGTNFFARRKREEILFQNNPYKFHKLVHLLIFIEKVVSANVDADPSAVNKRSLHFFGVAVQKIWNTLPTRKINAIEVSWFLQHCYSLASQEEGVCVRSLLNTSLVLIDSLKDLVPEHKEELRDSEYWIFKMLEGYDPDILHEDSQVLGEKIANEILKFLETPCTSR